MALSNNGGDSTMTPPATPTSPRFTTLPIRSSHTASCAKHNALQTINTTMTIGNNPKSTMSSPSSYLYTSPDGVWENATPYAIMHEAPIGTGLWSSVYLATPRSPIAYAQQYIASPSPTSPETPPATPVRRRGQSNSVSSTDSYMTQFSSSTAASTATQAGMTSELTATSGGLRPLSSPPPPPAPSAIWAIKAPADRAAFSVIRSEARMLTHIFSSTTTTKTSPTDFMVPFLGLDPRSGGLLMQALPLTLEDLIRGDLASFGSGADGEAARARLVASLFPRLAARLLTGLQWLHEDAGVVHADVKPSNILLRPAREGVAEAMIRRRLRGAAARLATAPPSSLMEEAGRPSLLVRRGNNSSSSRSSSSDEEGGEREEGRAEEEDVRTIDFEPLYTDFSAAIPIRPFPSPSSANDPSNTTSPPSSPSTTATAPPPHLAGGTWDFLAPELCRLHPAPAPPSPATDVYALGVTLLCVVVGESPFEALAGGNAFRKREMVKCGDAVGFAREVPRARFARVKGEVGKRWRREEEAWDWERWMRRGLVKKAEMRVGAKEWRRELEGLA